MCYTYYTYMYKGRQMSTKVANSRFKTMQAFGGSRLAHEWLAVALPGFCHQMLQNMI